MPATSVMATPLRRKASAAVSRCAVQISSGSCSTQPGCGKPRPISRCASDRTPPSAANTMARALVVPWSRARITRLSFDSPAIVPPIRSAVSASIIASGGAGPSAVAERGEHPRTPANDLDDDGDGAGGDVFVRHRVRHAPTVVETWDELVCPDDRPATDATFGAYLEGRVPIFDVEQRLRTASGEWKWIRARGTAVALDASGAPMRMVGTHADISDRKQVEEDVRLSADRLRRTVDGDVEAMGAMTAARDPYTAGHEKRVTELAVAMAAEMGRGQAAIEGLRLAGLVHDAGKLTAAAHQILKPIDFERPVADIVAQHHERQDGSGYPAGLKDAQILPEARILAVADVVEAMASHRPYRAALGLEAALAEVRSDAGTRYEAAAAAACQRVFAHGFVFTEW